MRKLTWTQKFRLYWRLLFNRMIYGQPTLCAKHSNNQPALSVQLDSFNCEKCSPEEIERSKMQQNWFNLLTPQQMSLAESDWNALIDELENPREINPKLKEAFRLYEEKYGKDLRVTEED